MKFGRAPIATVVCVAALVVSTGPPDARAHQRSLSYSSWSRSGGLLGVTVRISELDASRLAFYGAAGVESEAALARLLTSEVRATSGEVPCTPTGAAVSQTAPIGWRVYRWSLRCPAPGSIDVHVDLLFDAAPSHLHFARYVESALRGEPGGEDTTATQRSVTSVAAMPIERVLTAESRDWSLPRLGTTSRESGTSLGTYVLLGIGHILGGYDHLAFVLALVLIAASLREVVELVTAFTVAHSLTLAAAVLGLARPVGTAVEAVIGFSIALVAVENAWLLSGRDRAVPRGVAAVLALLLCLSLAGFGRLAPMTLGGLLLFTWCHFGLLTRARSVAQPRAIVAFCFGLAHGFGFAGVLTEVGLPARRTAVALFGFNAGVELGQLAVIALVWPLLVRADRRGGRRLVAEMGSAAIGGLGVFWFLVRAFG